MIIGDLVDQGFAEIKTGPFGTQLRASDYVDTGRPVLNVRNVGLGDVRADSLEFVDEETATRLSTHLLQKGDIVFGRKGAVERHAFIGEEFDGAMQGSDCIRLRIAGDSPIPAAFITFALRTKQHQAWMQAFCSHGATMASLNQAIVRQIPLPDLDTVRQQAAIGVLQTIDDLIANNRRRVEVLEEMARTIYREWFVRFRFPGHENVELVDSELGPIPERWQVRKVGDVARLIRGRSYRKHELVEVGGLPFVNLKCMARGGGFRRDGLKRYDGEFKAEQLVEADDIVLAVTDLTQGREILARATLVPRLPDGKGVISLDVVRLVPLTESERVWVFAALRWSDFADRVKEYANGSTVLHLSPTHLADAWILWPPEDMRNNVSSTVDPMLKQTNELHDAVDALTAMRDLLLPKLVTGQIDVSSLDLDALVEGAVA